MAIMTKSTECGQMEFTIPDNGTLLLSTFVFLGRVHMPPFPLISLPDELNLLWVKICVKLIGPVAIMSFLVNKGQ